MGLHIIMIVLSIILFYIVNWIGAKSKPLDLGYVQMSVGLQEDTAPMFNYLFKVIAPIVYIILLAVLFQSFGYDNFCEHLYLIVVYYWLYRFLYITVRGQLPLLNWRVQILYWLSSILLALWVNSIIDRVESVLPSPQALLEQFWILIILFLYTIFNKINFSREGAEKRIKKYTYHKVSIFNKRYGEIIDKQFSSDFYKAVVYSIMVYEDFNRPKIARFMERMLFHYSRKPHTYGIMQVTSSKPLTDEESVIKACEKIKDDVMTILPEIQYYDEKSLSLSLSVISCRIFSLYNPGDTEYHNQANQVYENIVEKFYPSISDDIDEMTRTELLKL